MKFRIDFFCTYPSTCELNIIVLDTKQEHRQGAINFEGKTKRKSAEKTGKYQKQENVIFQINQ